MTGIYGSLMNVRPGTALGQTSSSKYINANLNKNKSRTKINETLAEISSRNLNSSHHKGNLTNNPSKNSLNLNRHH